MFFLHYNCEIRMVSFSVYLKEDTFLQRMLSLFLRLFVVHMRGYMVPESEGSVNMYAFQVGNYLTVLYCSPVISQSQMQ